MFRDSNSSSSNADENCKWKNSLADVDIAFRRSGGDIPSWFAFESVCRVLRESVAQQNGSSAQ